MKKVLVISAAPLIRKSRSWAAYSPYVKEMEIWAKNSDEIYFCCPIWEDDRRLLNTEINFKIAKVYKLEEFSLQNIKEILNSFRSVLINFIRIVEAMKAADHLHLRCPGNAGLIACFAQVFFPSKPKSAKYAGNWDPESKQPLSYRLQKWILSNTFLTKNMTVLVYGDWKSKSKNIKPFFTASYFENDKLAIADKSLDGIIKFLFVGTLSTGKRPFYAVRLVHELLKAGKDIRLEVYGEGEEREKLEEYIENHSLQRHVVLYGNKEEKFVRVAFQQSHFTILPSKSEGWPKVLSEAMFWKCLPLASDVSCVSYMLGDGSRGEVLTLDLQNDRDSILNLLNSPNSYHHKAQNAMDWSRDFTLDLFEKDIRQIINI